MEVGSAHPNFKLSTILNLKDARPRHPNQNCYGQFGEGEDEGNRDRKWKGTSEQATGELVAPWLA
jgi:hypothetical protein